MTMEYFSRGTNFARFGRVLGFGSMMISASLLNSCSAPLSASKLKSEQRQSVVLGLNDVAIQLPYETHPEMIAKAPVVDDFVPKESLDEIKAMLIDDEATHQQENMAFGTLGDLTLEADIAAVGYSSSLSSPPAATPFRLVSVRIDPCGNALARKLTHDDCTHEVRIVWQPMDIQDGRAFTRDINLHSIHRLDDQSFHDFIRGLKALKSIGSSSADELLLQPHPVMDREGAEGPYFKGLMALLRKEVGIKNLARVAFFADTDPNAFGHWVMLAFDRVDGKIVRSPSPMLGKQDGEIQKLVQRIPGAPNRLGEPLPRGDFAHNLFPEMTAPPAMNDAGMMEFLKNFLLSSYESAIALENPTLHEPANADCASCHRATLEKSKLKAELEAMGAELPRNEFKGPNSRDQDLSSTSLQIFGFFKHQGKIGKRVVNDAALSVERINALERL